MRNRKSEDTMFLLGGALLGAAAMYLLDPESGRRRRETLAETASDTLGSTGKALGAGWEQVSDRAQDWTGRARDYAADVAAGFAERARDYKDRAGDYASDAADRARDAGSGASDRARSWLSDAGDSASSARDRLGDWGSSLLKRARGWGDDARDRADDASSNVRSWFNHATGREEKHSAAVPAALTGVGACAVGLGLMYILDPQRGRARRSYLQGQVTRIVRQTGDAFRGTGQHIANHLRGYAAETRGMMRSDNPSADQLLSRVRSEIGHVASHPRLIDVATDTYGTITLIGHVLASEVPQVLAVVNRVPGVQSIVNRLEIHDSEASIQQAAIAQSVSSGGASPREGIPQM